MPWRRSFHATRHMDAIKPFLLADIGEGITECEVIQWFVEPGQTVAEFDKICEVQSDKASVEITSRFSGTISKLHYNVNDVAKVGEPLVDIEVAGEEGAEASSEAVKEQPQQQPEPQPTPSTTAAETTPSSSPSSSTLPADHYLRTLATPAVRRVAKENNVDIRNITGTGKDGRVLKEDVVAFVNGGGSSPSSATASTTTTTFTTPTQPDQVKPLTAIQKAMFKSMTKSVAIPQLGYKDEMELNATTEYRAALNKLVANDNTGRFAFQKVSYMPILVKCLSVALTQYPILNATLMGAESGDVGAMQLQYRGSHNIGVAMDTPQGLIVPNIKDVQNKSVLEVASELHRLAELGAKNSLSPADLQGATITVSNIGTIGGTYANPCLIASEMAIVALGRMQTLPRFDEQGNVIAKQILPISWSADHRIIDGATIARFGNYWKRLVENPLILASELR
ncbi:hypothetical protein O0I10_008639 [Lichtheimia ornata]|uniref:Dihydrolipoamide acetyltransferase component of pyruvate dehydrogenase complex n=1 Tax=Lichtheimia ornata TaxID=688661 RepID=A0AAD7UZ77_9FUNG|nr:uncharacterized protein O0I10_008639 [Lichtheimia ornata]KAJ8655753.1 hypothetical protein O0I10_008639 [Lichtheimia ornata]